MAAPASERLYLWIAYFIIYFIWGANFIATHFALLGLPPFLVGSLRFFIAGVLLFPVARLTGEARPVATTVRTAILQGWWLNVAGTGLLIFSQQYLASGLAAIGIATVPMWMVILDAGKWRENFRSWPLLIGIALGIGGVVLLTGLGRTLDVSPNFQLGFLVLSLSAVCWAYGSLYSKRVARPASFLYALAIQMSTAGVLLFGLSGLTGEWVGLQLSAVTPQSWLAVAYLVVVSSVIGYICYLWLLRVRPATEVGTYTFIHPFVAVALGVVLADEVVNTRILLAMGLILLAVFFIRYPGMVRRLLGQRTEAEALP